MRHVSVCSGAGGMDLGFEAAGSRCVALCEWLPWLQDLLAARFPGVPVFPDLSELDPGDLPDADLLIGGTPCQDLSIGGRQAGLDGERSGLFWDFIRVRNGLEPAWTVWENVEGALSSSNGLDFACVLGAFVGADVHVPPGGWARAGVVAGPWGGAVWRVLDAQHFGVPQRRKRVFVVGRLGGPCPPEVLLEPAGGRGTPEPRRGKRAPTPPTSGVGPAGLGVDWTVSGTLGAKGLDGGNGCSIDRSGAYVVVPGAAPDADGVGTADGLAGSLDRAPVTLKLGQTGANGSNLMRDRAPTLDTEGGRVAVAFHMTQDPINGPVSPALSANADIGVISEDMPPRITSALDPYPDGRRYAACGNGVAKPVAEWIGRRLMEVSR